MLVSLKLPLAYRPLVPERRDRVVQLMLCLMLSAGKQILFYFAFCSVRQSNVL